MDIQVASDSNKPTFCIECKDQEVKGRADIYKVLVLI
jgi:hypothetical protein